MFTYRRAISGIFCKKHRNIYLILASAITASIGWIGIPYGIIYAPIALFKLARGGEQLNDSNIQILRSMAKYKKARGDLSGAQRCLEACLQFGDDDEIRKEIHQLRMKQFIPEKNIKLRTKLSSTLALLLGAALIGTIIGVLDYVLTQVFSFILQGDLYFYIAIATWAPFIAMAFIGGIVLFQMIEWMIARTSLQRTIIAVCVSGLSALIAVYSIAQGEAICDYIFYSVVGGAFETVFTTIFAGVIVAILGGVLWMIVPFDEPTLGGTIFVVLMAVILIYYFGMAIRTARRTVEWQKQINYYDNIT